jgi:hypothetical protein
MKPTSLLDRRASSLLNRVRDDISHLRDDVASLLNHTTKRTIPNGAREIADQARTGARDFADQARNQLAVGGAYAASRFRDFRGQPRCQSASWVGGAVVVGLLAYGAYALYRHNCNCVADDESEDLDEVPEG